MRIKKKLLTLVVIGVVAVLAAMGSFPLLAGELDTGGAYLDGTWFVMVTVTGQPPFPVVVTFTPNTLASGVQGTDHGQAPPGQFPTPAGLLTILPSVDGVWKRTGDGEYLCHEIRLATNEDGVVAATMDIWVVFHKEAEDRVTGTIKAGILDLDGNLLGAMEGTLEATPLSLEPPEFITVEGVNKALVSRFFEEALNQRNLDTIDEIFAADSVYHTAVPPFDFGPEDLKGFILEGCPSEPGAHYTVEEMVAEGNEVAVHWTFTTAASKKPAIGISIFYIASGKIEVAWTGLILPPEQGEGG